MRRTMFAAIVAALALPAQAQTLTLHGASQFNDDHAFTKAMVRFEELMKKYSGGKSLNFVLHKNSELGLEKQYFEYMAQGKAVDYAIVSPAHMSTFSRAAPFIDAPFLFRDLAHWNKVLDQDVLKPIADEIAQKADVILIGYAGGGTRNIFVNKPVKNMQELKALKVRVQGAPIWSRTFQAAGMAPTVIAYNEVYNAIQNGVIAAGENEAAGVEQMKFYEVAPHLAMTQHAITIRPLCFSGKTFKKLDKDLQAAVLRAGKEAGAHGRQIESSEDEQKLVQMEKEGKLKRVQFSDRAQMQKAVEPVIAAYAKEIGAGEILAKIKSIQYHARGRVGRRRSKRSPLFSCSSAQPTGTAGCCRGCSSPRWRCSSFRCRCRSSRAIRRSFRRTSGPRRWRGSSSSGPSCSGRWSGSARARTSWWTSGRRFRRAGRPRCGWWRQFSSSRSRWSSSGGGSISPVSRSTAFLSWRSCRCGTSTSPGRSPGPRGSCSSASRCGMT